MSTALVSCATCGDLELTTADLTVHIWDSNDHGDFSFRCPICAAIIVIPAGTRTIDLLMASGLTPQSWGQKVAETEALG